MNPSVRPELPTAALRSSQATHAAVDNSAPFTTHPESTYKSGKAVQTNGATSIFTHDPKLLQVNPEVFKLIPGGGIWIGAPHGGGTIGIKPKSKLVSMVSSTKHSCRLRRLRLRVAKKLAKAGLADVFGLNQWVHINETLDYYMFSIVVEEGVSMDHRHCTCSLSNSD